MIIVFNTIPASIAQAQSARHDETRARMDSLRNAHIQRADALKKEMLERHQALQERIQKPNAENVVIINGKVYSAKDSLEIKMQPGMEIEVKGDGNAVIIESKGNNNSVIISQSGSGNKVSVNNNTQNQPKKEHEDLLR
ncbi:curlin repeat-containing protein [Belliella aquatica]|uniref:Type IV pilus biogenesis protein PilP n=2 Tax=Belliella aquatica TaxID=1323734 RepID=A0ABQ1MJ16_9BACT|nr:curlin repeat-containing protein [Belliella aquatica]GGC39438.1 hypothetical protein GCM10010993_17740 [Belliella aquatica]